MQPKNISAALRNKLHSTEATSSYINYLKTVKNIEKVPDLVLVKLFEKVAQDGYNIDGDLITLTPRWDKNTNQYSVTVNYDYRMYKKLLFRDFPDTQVDIGLVAKEDSYSFKKESGKVVYTHTIADPFGNEKEYVGGYILVKNKRGEFLEILNRDEINKMKNSAKTKTIWNAWESEMIKKSLYKRIAKHFNDTFQNIEALDNENYDPEMAKLPAELQDLIDNCPDHTTLQKIYEQNIAKANEEGYEPEFLKAMSERKIEME